MNAQYSADDALQDVCSLQKLITYSHVTIDMMCKYSISIECALDNYMYEKGDVNLHTQNNTLQQQVVSKQIAMKIARSGLSFRHLKLAVDRGAVMV